MIYIKKRLVGVLYTTAGTFETNSLEEKSSC